MAAFASEWVAGFVGIRNLSKSEIIKAVNFYQALWVMDESIAGLVSVLGKWEERGIALSKQQVDHVKKMKERIESLYNVLTVGHIRRFSDFPSDYSSVKKPETVVG